MVKKFKYKKNLRCRICNNKDLIEYLDLGMHPPSNSFIKKKDFSKEQFFPLIVQLCESCGLSQLNTVVSANDIFDEYLYLSSTSKALVKHYKEMVEKILKKIRPKKKSLIVDIGCNDGITLKNYSNNYNILGIEPSSSGLFAKKQGIKIEKIFFNKKNANNLLLKYGKAKIITATNVFAHVDDIQDFVSGVSKFLDTNGVFIIEFPYLKNMLEDVIFDVIYHEHLSYLSVTPLYKLFSMYKMNIFDIEKINIGASGPALRVYVSHRNAKYKQKKIVKIYLNMEKKLNFKKIDTYLNFSDKVNLFKENILKKLDSLKCNNKLIGAYGAPAKGNTMLNYLKLNSKLITAVADNTPLKIGKFTPGSHIPIVSDSEFEKLGIEYALLLSWNYVDFFVNNSSYIKRSGKFIVPFPKINIVP